MPPPARDGTPPPDDDNDDDDTVWRTYATSRSRHLRNSLVERHLGLAHHIAGRLGGHHDDDLRQVAMLALVRAVERFDPSRGVSFSTFAGVTIEGAVKQHLDRARWPVAVPRRLKHLALDVSAAREALEQELGRSPTVAELSARLDVSPDDVVEALAAARTRSGTTIGDLGGTDHVDAGEDDDPTGRAAIDRTEVEALLDTLTGTDRRVVELRFVDQLLQQQIADAVGISQMHVSRIIRRSIDALRARADDGDVYGDRGR